MRGSIYVRGGGEQLDEAPFHCREVHERNSNEPKDDGEY